MADRGKVRTGRFKLHLRWNDSLDGGFVYRSRLKRLEELRSNRLEQDTQGLGPACDKKQDCPSPHGQVGARSGERLLFS